MRATTAVAPKPDLRILIADDNYDSRRWLTRVLRQTVEAELHEARDGADAVREALRLRPQLLFIDIEMPGLNGFDALREIRAGGFAPFVVVVSAAGSLARVQEALALGIGAFVAKPYSPQRIADVIGIFASGGNASRAPGR